MTSVTQLRGDLVDEQDSLEVVVGDLSDDQWYLPTASPGWNVFDQVAHLAYFDERAALALNDPEGFRRGRDEMFSRAGHESLDVITLKEFRSLSPSELLLRWRDARSSLDDAARTLGESSRVDWYGPTMSAKSFLTARLMETWAHGVDVVEALGVSREPTERLIHIVRLGVVTRPWSYRVRGEEPPHGSVRVELSGPRGDVWRQGPDDADETVQGPAEEFCLVVTQRRHLDDTTLVTGILGRHWLLRAQAFAGAPSAGPAPKGRP
ncbi:MAG: TIGR03084 family metal-binding protein [Acidimicrobiales bacterium]